MDQALHLIADRIAAMAPPAREVVTSDENFEAFAYDSGMRDGHAEAVRRVVSLLRWIADGDESPRWVWVSNLSIPEPQGRRTLRQIVVKDAGVSRQQPFILPSPHGGLPSLWVSVPMHFAKQHSLAYLTARPENAVNTYAITSTHV